MGSRLSVNLSELLSHPNISVTMYQIDISDLEDKDKTYDHVANVRFNQLGGRAGAAYFFDWFSNQGEIELSCDFNFFRYTEEDPKLEMLRYLYEFSIGFTVNH